MFPAMNDQDYNSSLQTFSKFHTQSIFGVRTLSEQLRNIYRDLKKDGDQNAESIRGLRVLSIGPGHGDILEETLRVVCVDGVKIDRLDCVESNPLVVDDLGKRMSLLSEMYGFQFTIYPWKFSSDSVSLLPKDFYDLLEFSQVFYYIEDAARVLESSLYGLTAENGRALIRMVTSTAFLEINNEIRRLLDPNASENVDELAYYTEASFREVITKARGKLISHSVDTAGCLVHLALQTDKSYASERDVEIQKIGDQILTFFAHRKIPETMRARVQDIIRKYVVECYGFPIVPVINENFLVARA